MLPVELAEGLIEIDVAHLFGVLENASIGFLISVGGSLGGGPGGEVVVVEGLRAVGAGVGLPGAEASFVPGLRK